MKTYYLALSKVFPSTHPRAGEPTDFRNKLHAALKGNARCLAKRHTIRANYDLWAKRFEKIAAGEAVLSVREWVGKPYGKGSTMRELALLTHEDGIGVQRLEFRNSNIFLPRLEGRCIYYPSEIAHKDGLGLRDWLDWFKGCDLSKPMAIIHFTNYRYNA